MFETRAVSSFSTNICLKSVVRLNRFFFNHILFIFRTEKQNFSGYSIVHNLISSYVCDKINCNKGTIVKYITGHATYKTSCLIQSDDQRGNEIGLCIHNTIK